MRSHEIFIHGHFVEKCETGIEDKLKAYYERNKDKIAENKKAYRERNKDKLKAKYVKSARNFVNWLTKVGIGKVERVTEIHFVMASCLW